MAKPTQVISWATDATFAADADPWAGDANKIDPGNARRNEGAEPDTFPSEWFNYHLNAIGLHIEYIHDVLELVDDVAGPELEVVFRGAWLDDEGSGVTVATDGVTLRYDTNFVDAHVDISRFIPTGGVIVQIEALVSLGSAQTGANRMSMDLETYAPDFSTPTLGSLTAIFHADAPATVTGERVIDSGVISHTVLASDINLLRVQASNGAGGATDDLRAIRITFNDPGPRNI